MTTLRVFGAFVRTTFLESLEYRARFAVGVGSYFIFVAVYYYIWQAVYAASPEPQVGGYNLDQIVTYAAVAWVIRSFYYTRADMEIAEAVRKGDITRYLLHPINHHLARLAESFGESSFRMVALTAPSAVLVFLVFPVAGPAGLFAALAFGVSLLLSFTIFFELAYLVGLSAAFTKQAAGLRRAKTAAVEFLSGLLVPLSFFPGWAQGVLVWLPFRMVADVPLNVYLGKYAGSEAFLLIAAQAGWALLLHAVGHLLWRAVVRRLTIQGG